ncbi:progestin and adipoQ receptor family member 4 isoform X3 [Chanodichthys erythropterus]|uniref:progestin and adipoQ receptor family member 4 isoform X3 n=1 Tax=Chanodichthys erythropterus TaxID=933992 RepID=UPI00351E46AB
MDLFAGPKLLDFKNSPPHLQFNKYVLTGYRPISTYRDCLRSLFYLHNEFGNIYTHGALPIIYITLLCYPSSRRVAMLAYLLLSGYGVHCAVTARSNVHRLQSFVWQAFFRFLLFMLRLTGAGRGSPSSLRLYFTMDALALLGGLVNISRLPERFSPGRFDYWLNSHQIMHIMVILSILYLHWGMLEDLTWLKVYHCPGE